MHIPHSLLTHLRHRFALDWHGIHGVAHWARVARIGDQLVNGVRVTGLCSITVGGQNGLGAQTQMGRYLEAGAGKGLDVAPPMQPRTGTAVHEHERTAVAHRPVDHAAR